MLFHSKIINTLGSNFRLLCFYISHSLCLYLIDLMRLALLGFVLFLYYVLVFSLVMSFLCLGTSEEMSFVV